MIIMIQGYMYYKASWHIIHSILQRESLNTLSFSALANSYSFHYFWQCCRHLCHIEYRIMNKKLMYTLITFWAYRFFNFMKWYIFSDVWDLQSYWGIANVIKQFIHFKRQLVFDIVQKNIGVFSKPFIWYLPLRDNVHLNSMRNVMCCNVVSTLMLFDVVGGFIHLHFYLVKKPSVR